MTGFLALLSTVLTKSHSWVEVGVLEQDGGTPGLGWEHVLWENV